eukprot:g28391.t1
MYNWQYPFWDDKRRSYVGHLQSFWTPQQCNMYFAMIHGNVQWLQPEGDKGPMPRKRLDCDQRLGEGRTGIEMLPAHLGPNLRTAWLVKPGCECRYSYGPFEVPPAPFPPWMISLMAEVMPACGFPNMTEWPEALGLQADRLVDQLFPTKENQVQDGSVPLRGTFLDGLERWSQDCCNLNLYMDGSNTVGWHADDESLFQGKHQDITIISLSLGMPRRFELRYNWPETAEEDEVLPIILNNGDLMTMEGMTQMLGPPATSVF